MKKDNRPILGADIRPLTVDRGGIVNRKKRVQQFAITNDAGIVFDLDDLGVPGCAGTYLCVRRILCMSTRVSAGCATDAIQFIKLLFDAPKTSTTKCS